MLVSIFCVVEADMHIILYFSVGAVIRGIPLPNVIVT